MKVTKLHEAESQINYAVVGLGYFAQAAVLPAFKHASKNSRLAALVSGDPEKLAALGEKYDVDRLYSYEQFDDCLHSGDVDAVYIALPNHLHKEYSVRAAQAGVHVLCEKPMAVREEECREMIRAAAAHGVQLMIAYRLHFEEANLKAIELANSGKLGEVRGFDAYFGLSVEEGNIRLQAELGGGTLFDIGIYCINAARYLFRDEPMEGVAFTTANHDSRFEEVEESTSAMLRFPGERVATFTASFNTARVSSYRIVGTKGDLRVEPAFDFDDTLRHYLTIDGKTTEESFKRRDQVAPELLYFSDCVLRGEAPEPSGYEGLADVRIIEALYRSAREKTIMRLEPMRRATRPSLDQEIRKPAARRPELVHARSPSGE